MPDPAIRIRGLSKAYTISHDRERSTSLREAVTRRLRSPFRRAETETFWALKDIDLDVERGEVVGVIGRNGAGKSTLLKVLSRITEPTAGRVELFGRVGSLLEVGTGFHPELTGRENIYLNGAILGMRRPEIRRQFDAIIDFAGVEKFLDTPVKRYSSGMYVRLAFAVAAHLNPEILIVDEVLAVGDAEFQKKCLGKMQDVAQSGRTVLFVSHNMGAVLSLTSRALVLHKGRSAFYGRTPEALTHYSTALDVHPQQGTAVNLFNSLLLQSPVCCPQQSSRHSSHRVSLQLKACADEVIYDIALLLHGPDGNRIALFDLRSPSGPYYLDRHATARFELSIPDLPLVEGAYDLGVYVNCNGGACSTFDGWQLIAPPIEHPGIERREPQYRGLLDVPFTFTALHIASNKTESFGAKELQCALLTEASKAGGPPNDFA
ncbi:MAG: ABC transporter ATP-binding protein [Lacipirellulaceae bacterium]